MGIFLRILDYFIIDRRMEYGGVAKFQLQISYWLWSHPEGAFHTLAPSRYIENMDAFVGYSDGLRCPAERARIFH